MLFKDAPGLAGAAVTVDIVDGDLPVFPDVPVVQKLLTELIHLPDLEAIAGIDLQDLHIAQTVLNMLHQLRHPGCLLLRLIRDRTELLERPFHTGVGLVGIGPLSFLADIVPVAPGGSRCLVNVGGGKSLLDGLKPHGRLRIQIHMGMISSGCADLIGHAEIIRIKLLCPVDDLLMGHTGTFGVVDRQQEFPGLITFCEHGFFSFFATATSLA